MGLFRRYLGHKQHLLMVIWGFFYVDILLVRGNNLLPREQKTGP